jgi:hypothetical protein
MLVCEDMPACGCVAAVEKNLTRAMSACCVVVSR